MELWLRLNLIFRRARRMKTLIRDFVDRISALLHHHG